MQLASGNEAVYSAATVGLQLPAGVNYSAIVADVAFIGSAGAVPLISVNASASSNVTAASARIRPGVLPMLSDPHALPDGPQFGSGRYAGSSWNATASSVAVPLSIRMTGWASSVLQHVSEFGRNASGSTSALDMMAMRLSDQGVGRPEFASSCLGLSSSGACFLGDVRIPASQAQLRSDLENIAGMKGLAVIGGHRTAAGVIFDALGSPDAQSTVSVRASAMSLLLNTSSAALASVAGADHQIGTPVSLVDFDTAEYAVIWPSPIGVVELSENASSTASANWEQAVETDACGSGELRVAGCTATVAVRIV